MSDINATRLPHLVRYPPYVGDGTDLTLNRGEK
uniref:MSDIN-like toxin proprotein 2 n=1 Tax=Amanita fuligineoides TaxID=580329 RepID=MSD2_AMAFL|nr:RecName: Full=MSDIN-like toxin proprotein 2; Contains: RecName: Full=Toxin MSD2; Flags: Precursor [Amanita fuligineoides]AHB18706.1 MSDIN-like protein [Amanita fuligineoides]